MSLELFAALDATWPAERFLHEGPWTFRLTKGAGRRVSAASLAGEPSVQAIEEAEVRLAGLGHERLFAIRPGQDALDRMLAEGGYEVVDPVELRAGPIADFPDYNPMRAFPHWPPLAVVREVWEAGGIGAARQAVMDRVQGPKCAIVGRSPGGSDRVAGAGFVGVHGKVAMIHSLEVVPDLRRQGSANQMMCAAAKWAQDQGAEWLALLVKADNEPAVRLYASLGMGVVGHYHYRRA